MSLLINSEILEKLGDAIVISPFHADQLNTNSYDLCVGPNIARYKRTDGPLFLAEQVAPFALEHHPEGFYLAPGERVLAHSVEFAGGRVARKGSYPHAVTTSLRATSTAGRLGLSVCQCAGLGDVGYIDRWTYELQNHSPNTVFIPVGAILAQIEFHLVEVPPEETLYGKTGSYQGDMPLEELVMTWRAEKMLPKRLKVKMWVQDVLDREEQAIDLSDQ